LEVARQLLGVIDVKDKWSVFYKKISFLLQNFMFKSTCYLAFLCIFGTISDFSIVLK